jgi:hypothetical protein
MAASVKSDREKTARLHRLLEKRHLGGDSRNGDAWAYFTEVRNKTGYGRGPTRSADAFAMSLWPSRGLLLHGFEVKASRTDWLRELRDPSKADEFIRYCEHWWLVTEPDVVEAGELPATWGHLVRRGGKLVQATAAPVLEPEECDRKFLAALLRAAGHRAATTPEEITAAEAAGRESERQILNQRVELYQGQLDQLREEVAKFQKESGLTLNGRYPAPYGPEELGAAVKLVLTGEAKAEVAEERLRRCAEQAEGIAAHVRELLPATDEEAANV